MSDDKLVSAGQARNKLLGNISVSLSTLAGTASNFPGVFPISAPVTSNYTILTSDYTIICDASGGGFSVTLPLAGTAKLGGKTYNIKKVDSSANIVTILPSGADTIDGNAAFALLSQNQSVALQGNGTTKWYTL